MKSVDRMNKFILLICCLFAFFPGFFFGQDSESLVRINRDNVNLRASQANNSKSITVLNEGNQGMVMETESPESDYEYRIFNWFKVSVNKFTGWVYGEYVDFNQINMTVKKYRVYNANETKVLVGGNTIYLGMKEADLVLKIGSPEKKKSKEGISVRSYEYFKGGLYVEINDASKCVSYIKISDPSIELASGIKVGTGMAEITSANDATKMLVKDDTISIITIYAPSYNQWYSPFAIFDISKAKQVERIYLGINMD